MCELQSLELLTSNPYRGDIAFFGNLQVLSPDVDGPLPSYSDTAELTWVEPKFRLLRRAMARCGLCPAARPLVDSYRINSSGVCCSKTHKLVELVVNITFFLRSSAVLWGARRRARSLP